MKINKWASITFECHRFNRDGNECEDVAALCSTVFDIIMDVNVPIKYRIKMMTHAYALAVKFDPAFEENPDFAALCRQLIAGPETKKVGEYYLKKWNDYHADLGREGAIE